MKKRFVFKCWNCGKNYSLFKEISEEQELIVECPYCNKEAVVMLEPFKKKTTVVMRDVGDEDPAIGYEYDFPEVIPTQQPEE